MFDGKDITAHAVARAAGARHLPVARGPRLFPGMTVRENLEMGAYARQDRKTAAVTEDLERVFELFPRLKERGQPGRRHDVRRRAADAGDGPGADGRPQAAAARRAVDGAGAEADPADLRHHHARSTRRAPRCCSSSRTPRRRSSGPHRAYILETGEIVREGTGAELAGDDSVKAAYLGGDV